MRFFQYGGGREGGFCGPTACGNGAKVAEKTQSFPCHPLMPLLKAWLPQRLSGAVFGMAHGTERGLWGTGGWDLRVPFCRRIFDRKT